MDWKSKFEGKKRGGSKSSYNEHKRQLKYAKIFLEEEFEHHKIAACDELEKKFEHHKIAACEPQEKGKLKTIACSLALIRAILDLKMSRWESQWKTNPCDIAIMAKICFMCNHKEEFDDLWELLSKGFVAEIGEEDFATYLGAGTTDYGASYAKGLDEKFMDKETSRRIEKWLLHLLEKKINIKSGQTKQEKYRKLN